MDDLKKCIVWDLDDTLWQGVCLEGDVVPKPDVIAEIRELDRRGILHSIASRGDADCALSALRAHGLDDYFLAPRINWLPKSQNIGAIARDLNIATSAIAFIDDDRFEREQVACMIPDVLVLDATEAGHVSTHPAFSTVDVTSEGRERRRLYKAEIERQRSALTFASREEFLAWSLMQLRVRPVQRADIPRVRELMSRTHQLNTTGLTFDPDAFFTGPKAQEGTLRCVVAELQDRFGNYGIIGTGVVLVERPVCRVRYIAVSCRVLGRGVERALLASLLREGKNAGCGTFEAEFRDTGRNGMMRILYQMSHFHSTGAVTGEGTSIFRTDDPDAVRAPRWLEAL